MSAIKLLEEKIKMIYIEAGYEVEAVTLTVSNRPDLGEYQLNDAMKLAKIYHKSPIEIAKDITVKLEQEKSFKNVNIAGAGFINLTLTEEYLLKFLNEIKDPKKNIDLKAKKKIIIDYGGANVAKALHVGHLRSANIGEALKRLARTLGQEVIGDAHLGDSGLQSGVVVMEMMERFPNLPCFKENYRGEEFDLPITKEDLAVIYPTGSKKTKESEEALEKAREIASQIQNNHIGYNKLWDKISELSIIDIKETYTMLNATFELWEGERDGLKYIPEMSCYLEEKGIIYESEGAKVIDVSEESDKKEMPPLIYEKSNGTYGYAATDLATIYSRMKRFSPDEMWYVIDNRQELHMTQVFRASKKADIAKVDTKLEFLGFGTMNGNDGKPFKTRDGGVMSLNDLINLVEEETLKRINVSIVGEEEKEKTAHIIAISALKYADLIPNRNTDYVFDPSKFSDLEGKTAPYLLYSTIRMKSLLKKAHEQQITFDNAKIINNKTMKDIVLILLELPNVLNKAYEEKSLNEITDYIYNLTNSYNKLYAENKILSEENDDLRKSWLYLSQVVFNTNHLLLDLLGLKCPEKM